MLSAAAFLALPPSLICLLSQALAAEIAGPTAVRKLSPDPSEKLFPEHLAFAPLADLLPRDAPISEAQENDPDSFNGTTRLYFPAFAPHFDDVQVAVPRRAAEALAVLEKRAACPSGTSSCADIGDTNKCCQDGTYCVSVEDTDVGSVACCPSGATCGGGVGACPSAATSCPASLGGGCCIPGYVCQGVGCVPSASATSIVVETTTQEPSTTTTIEPSTTTEVQVTTTSSAESTTSTSTELKTTSTDETATGGAPYRPISSSLITSAPETTGSAQTGCPTGFYGCLATHGGGCCRTDRDCNTYSCPASSTTIVSDGRTIVVLATDVPTTTASSTCADGWFLCGTAAGPVAGCCPSGYSCGTASCFTTESSQTAKVQKEFPTATKSMASMSKPWSAFGSIFIAFCCLILF